MNTRKKEKMKKWIVVNTRKIDQNERAGRWKQTKKWRWRRYKMDHEVKQERKRTTTKKQAHRIIEKGGGGKILRSRK